MSRLYASIISDAIQNKKTARGNYELEVSIRAGSREDTTEIFNTVILYNAKEDKYILHIATYNDFPNLSVYFNREKVL